MPMMTTVETLGQRRGLGAQTSGVARSPRVFPGQQTELGQVQGSLVIGSGACSPGEGGANLWM